MGVSGREPCKEGNQSTCIQAEKPSEGSDSDAKLGERASLQSAQLDDCLGQRRALKGNPEIEEICSFDLGSAMILQAPNGPRPKKKIFL